MKLEWRAPLVSNEGWKLMRATTPQQAAAELAASRAVYDVQCRDAETKERITLHYSRNGGNICDTSHGPCSCGAWH